jgi:sugar lactone lactonase YvrE
VNEVIRATIHDALDVQEPPGLRSRVISSVPMRQARRLSWRLPPISGQWAAAVTALLLTAALLLALVSTRIGSRPETTRPNGTGLRLTNPSGVAIAPDGSVYVADYVGGRIYRIRPDGALVTVAGGGLQSEGPATRSNLFAPMGLAFGPNDSLYIGEIGGTRISRLDSHGNLSTIASTSGQTWGLAFNSAGELYASVGDGVAMIVPNGMHSIDLSSVGGPAVSPGYLAFDSRGNLYIADLSPPISSIQLTPPAAGGCRILRVTPTNTVSVIAGTGQCAYSGDGGRAASAELNNPNGIAIDAAGNLYIADSNNYRIRRIDTHGIITTVAGNGNANHTGDGGPAVDAKVGYVSGMAIAQDRYLYFAEKGGFNAYGAVRVIDLKTGIIRTVVDSYSRVVS